MPKKLLTPKIKCVILVEIENITNKSDDEDGRN